MFSYLCGLHGCGCGRPWHCWTSPSWDKSLSFLSVLSSSYFFTPPYLFHWTVKPPKHIHREHINTITAHTPSPAWTLILWSRWGGTHCSGNYLWGPFEYFARCLYVFLSVDRFCQRIDVATMQDRLTKLIRCTVVIKMKTKIEDGQSPSKGARSRRTKLGNALLLRFTHRISETSTFSSSFGWPDALLLSSADLNI